MSRRRAGAGRREVSVASLASIIQLQQPWVRLLQPMEALAVWIGAQQRLQRVIRGIASVTYTSDGAALHVAVCMTLSRVALLGGRTRSAMRAVPQRCRRRDVRSNRIRATEAPLRHAPDPLGTISDAWRVHRRTKPDSPPSPCQALCKQPTEKS